MDSADDFLEHFGVPGMKWGRRKSGPSSQDAARASKIASRAKTKGINNLSNDDLKKLNTRTQLEKQYKDLNPGSLAVGKKRVGAIIGIGGTAIAIYNMVNSPAGKAAMTAGRNAMYKYRFATGITKAITAG